MTADLKTRVAESLNNAIENGYELDDWTAEAIAEDIAEYDSQFESYEQEELIPHIQEWLDSRK